MLNYETLIGFTIVLTNVVNISISYNVWRMGKKICEIENEHNARGDALRMFNIELIELKNRVEAIDHKEAGEFWQKKYQTEIDKVVTYQPKDNMVFIK